MKRAAHFETFEASDESRSVHKGGWVVKELVETSVFTAFADLLDSDKLACGDACKKIAAANAENQDVERMVAAVGDSGC